MIMASFALFGAIGKPLITTNNASYEKKVEIASLKDSADATEWQNKEGNHKESKGITTAEIEKLISYLEDDLDKSGTSVEKELKKQSSIMKKKQESLSNKKTSIKNKNKIENQEQYRSANQSSVLEDMVRDYKEYKTNKAENPNRVVVNPGENVTAAMVLAAHSLVVSYFSNHNWHLSAELLTHMRENNELDSIYRPANSDIVYYSDTFRQLGYNAEKSGTGSFNPNAANVMHQDLYYAIHSFNYKKSLHNDAIILTDRYDFELDMTYDNLLQDLACNAMYEGQRLGVLKPYYTVVEWYNSYNLEPNASHTVEVSFSSSLDKKYKEIQLTLAQDDYVYVRFKFPTSGYRTLQTFGDKDTTLQLFLNSGGYLQNGYGDDEGFGSNALVSYYFEANVYYLALVQFYYSEDIGNIRLAFTPSNNTNYDSITKIQRTLNFLTYQYNNVLVETNPGCASLFTLAPALSTSFTIETTKKDQYQDTILFFIDPRRGDNHYSNNSDLASYTMNDDGGGNLQAKISLSERPTNVPFLIVASTYSSTLAGRFNLKISGLNSSLIPIL